MSGGQRLRRSGTSEWFIGVLLGCGQTAVSTRMDHRIDTDEFSVLGM